MFLPKFYDTTVASINRYNENTVYLELCFKDNESFQFRSGQFVLVYQTLDGNEDKRAFSIASRPIQKNIGLLIRKYDNGKISPLLFNLKSEDSLKIRGPFGMFNVKKPIKEETVFIAAGTGIAPLRSMIYEILESSHDNKVILVFGFRYESDFFFRKEFEDLMKHNKNFELHACATRPTESWPYHIGRVTDIIPRILNYSANKDIYICGPNTMINDTLNLLVRELNFSKDQVLFERWSAT